MPDVDGFWTGEEIYDASKAEWVGVLERLWKAINKPFEPAQLEIYIRELEIVPLGLLELAVARCIRENQYNNVPSVGSVWQAIRRELGNPYDIDIGIADWVREKAVKASPKFSHDPLTSP
jgi:hypothetical protein